MVFVDLTRASAKPGGGGIGIRGFMIGGAGHKIDAQVTMSMVDVETGKIVARSTHSESRLIGAGALVSIKGVTLGGALDQSETALLKGITNAIEHGLNKLFISFDR